MFKICAKDSEKIVVTDEHEIYSYILKYKDNCITSINFRDQEIIFENPFIYLELDKLAPLQICMMVRSFHFGYIKGFEQGSKKTKDTLRSILHL